MTSIADTKDIERTLLKFLGRANGASAVALIRDGIPLSALDRSASLAAIIKKYSLGYISDGKP